MIGIANVENDNFQKLLNNLEMKKLGLEHEAIRSRDQIALAERELDRIKEGTSNIAETFNKNLDDMVGHLALVGKREEPF